MERTLPEEREGAAGEDAAAAVDGVTVVERGGLALGRRGVDMGVDMVSQDHDRPRPRNTQQIRLTGSATQHFLKFH